MPSLTPPTHPPVAYPIDKLGTSSANLISNEVVTLSSGAIRAFSPTYSPFFKKNVSITDTVSGLVLNSSQYKCYNLVSTPSAINGLGNEVYAIIVITDAAVSNHLTVSYQTVGGAYTFGYETIATLVNNLLVSESVNDGLSLPWNTVNNLPLAYPENMHLHALGDTVGWEFVATQLEQIKLAIMLGDQINKNFVLSYIDQYINNSVTALANLTGLGTPFGNHVSNTSNPHNVTKAQLGLSNVQNYATATLAQAYAGSNSALYVTTDQVLAVVQNQINLGIDAHIINYGNPHSVTATQVGLGNVNNYPLATLADLTTPVPGTNKYVTNTVLGQWLNTYFTNDITATLGTVATDAAAAVVAANAAHAAATATLATATTLAGTLTSVSGQVTAALAAANQTTTDAASSTSAATTLLSTYAATAIAAAQATYYAKGYADGLASVNPL